MELRECRINSSQALTLAVIFRVITLYRPQERNAVDGPTAAALSAAFREFEADASQKVAILYGAGGTFCAGADLRALATDQARMNKVSENMKDDGPMGPSRMLLSKPTIAAICTLLQVCRPVLSPSF